LIVNGVLIELILLILILVDDNAMFLLLY